MSSTPTISRRKFIASTAASAAPLTAQNRPARHDPRPNIVFVLADDLRYDGLGCTGHPFAKTPHLDRIGKEGVIFDNYFCVTPLCSPSRASYLTGLYAHTHRIINNDKQGLGEISHTLPTFPRALFENGYETAFIGKWHMGFDDTRRPGFDHWVSFHAQGLYLNPVVNVDGERRQLRGYMTDFLNERAVKFLERPHTKPFVMYLAHKAVHFPYLPAARHDSLYRDSQFTPATIAAGDIEGKPVLRTKAPRIDPLRMEGATPEPQESRRGRPMTPVEIVRDQARCVASMDEGMGMICQTLEKIGQLDNTLIVFTSDNGYLMGEHGLFDNKRWAWEPSLRLPLVMRYPKVIPAGSHRSQMVLNIDIAPTAMDLAGIRPFGPMHGRPLQQVFKSSDAPLRDSFLAEYFLEKAAPGVPDWQCVRTSRWKYIQYPTLQGVDELYDLSTDAREERNLIDDPTRKEVVQQMKTEQTKLLRQATNRAE